MEQGQDLGRAAADVFVRLGGRVLARLPGYAGMRHGLKRPRPVLAPDREPKLGAEHVGSLDQPLFTAASGSLTRTTPCLRLRITTPVSHQVRLFCQLVVCEKGCWGAQAGVGAARHASCRTTRAAQRRAHNALSQATRSRRLWPAAARMALIASPCAPNRRLRSTRPSLFRCPITGSIALRRRSSRRIVGEVMPRVCETKTWVGPSSL